MAQFKWDQEGSRAYETGISKGVLYVMDGTTYGKGVVWNGLTSVSENPTGADANAIYADNIKYLNLIALEEFEATVNAYTFPDEFYACDGSAALDSSVNGVVAGQQDRKKFALCYQTKVGNDLNAEAGYKIHIIYGCQASPSERSYETVNDSPDAIEFSWDITTTPITDVPTGMKPTSIVTIDTTKLDETSASHLASLEDLLYDATNAKCLTPTEIVTVLKTGSLPA